ncbi:hypothetical protein [Actinoplanes sichuanensis]|uniref:Uncharacterized protein n=1 Tax=Actinoplanes sichuanensis TaxID=512349 RepID=A0ABW4A2Y5_9ACTN
MIRPYQPTAPLADRLQAQLAFAVRAQLKATSRVLLTQAAAARRFAEEAAARVTERRIRKHTTHPQH